MVQSVLYLLKIYRIDMKNKLSLSLIILAIIVSSHAGLATASSSDFGMSIHRSPQVSTLADVSSSPLVRVINAPSQNKSVVVTQPSFCKIEFGQSTGQIQFQTSIELHQSADCFSLSLGSVSTQKRLAVIDSSEKEVKINTPKPIVHFASIGHGDSSSAPEQAMVPSLNYINRNQSNLSESVPGYLSLSAQQIRVNIFSNNLSLLQIFRC